MALEPPLNATAEEIREGLLPLRNGLSVAVLAAGNPFAIGAIIRVAHSFLVREVLLVGTESHYEKASMGMQHLERVVRLVDEEAFFAYVHGRPVFAFEREQARRSYHDVVSYPENVVLAFGSERLGFPSGFLERCDDVLGIPLYGVNNSLPVAVATGIALAAWARVRYAPGTVITVPR